MSVSVQPPAVLRLREQIQRLEGVQQRARAVLPFGIDALDIDILSVLPWEPSVIVASTFQNGRVFLTGDAAHQMPPWGGLGANTGVDDAHTLAALLHAVLREGADPSTLTAYSAERQPIGLAAAEQSGARAGRGGLLAVPTMPR